MSLTSHDSTDHASVSLYGEALMHQLQQGWRPLPHKTLFALAMGGLRVRMMRSVVTMVSVVLAIAFLTYTGLSNYLTRNLAIAAQRSVGAPPAGEALQQAAETLLTQDFLAAMPLEQQRSVAASLGFDQTKAAENELVTLPDKLRKARLDLETAEKTLKTLQADKQALQADIVYATAKITAGKNELRWLQTRQTELSDKKALGDWIKSGDAASAATLSPRLTAVLRTRYGELGAAIPQLGRLSNGELDQLAVFLTLARSKAEPVMATVDTAMAQERDKRALVELRKLLQSTGVNVEKTIAGNPMDTWLIVMAMLTCAVGIANAMLMSVTERFREIGTMKCLGAQDNLVVKLFLLESAFLGVVGAALGIVLGLIVALLAAVLQYSSYGTQYFPVARSLQVVLMSVLGGVLLAVLGAVYPAFTASRMRPVDALRVDE